MHLAEFNLSDPDNVLDDPRMRGLDNLVGRIYRLAERSPGFVWRLKGERDDGKDFRYPGRPKTVVNLSVWESVQALEHFIWDVVHKKIFNIGGEWLGNESKPHLVMWPVPEGHRPDLGEACARLDYLVRFGPGEHAFGWDALVNLKRRLAEERM